MLYKDSKPCARRCGDLSFHHAKLFWNVLRSENNQTAEIKLGNSSELCKIFQNKSENRSTLQRLSTLHHPSVQPVSTVCSKYFSSLLPFRLALWQRLRLPHWLTFLFEFYFSFPNDNAKSREFKQWHELLFPLSPDHSRTPTPPCDGFLFHDALYTLFVFVSLLISAFSLMDLFTFTLPSPHLAIAGVTQTLLIQRRISCHLQIHHYQRFPFSPSPRRWIGVVSLLLCSASRKSILWNGLAQRLTSALAYRFFALKSSLTVAHRLLLTFFFPQLTEKPPWKFFSFSLLFFVHSVGVQLINHRINLNARKKATRSG